MASGGTFKAYIDELSDADIARFGGGPVDGLDKEHVRLG